MPLSDLFSYPSTTQLKQLIFNLFGNNEQKKAISIQKLIKKSKIYSHPALLSTPVLYFDYLKKKARDNTVHIMDAGCGTGINPLYVSYLMGDTASVIDGIDNNKDLINLANHFKNNALSLSDYIRNHTTIPDGDTMLLEWLDDMDNGIVSGENVNFISGDLSSMDISEYDGILLLESLRMLHDCHRKVFDSWNGNGCLLFSSLDPYYFMNELVLSNEKSMTFIIYDDHPFDFGQYDPLVLCVLTENTSLKDGNHILTFHRHLGDCSFEAYEIKHMDSNGIVSCDIKSYDLGLINEKLPLQLRTGLYNNSIRYGKMYDPNLNKSKYIFRIETSDEHAVESKMSLAKKYNGELDMSVSLIDSIYGRYYEISGFSKSSVYELAINLYDFENPPMMVSLI